MKFSSLPTPPELIHQFETGEISREELQATMALHARDLIEEMVDDHENPIKAYIERMRNKSAVKKLTRQHGGSRVREIFTAMGQITDFPPAHLLWNASHQGMPLYCFVRMKAEPIFRIKQMDVSSMRVVVSVEYGENDKQNMSKETLVLQRDPKMKLQLTERTVL